ncbi:MAG: UvrD-helicase domain-containing protein [Ilumatobacteraceae bacterium]
MNDDALLADLDDDQRRAVTCAPTATVIHAGAGSGKTRVLTHRIAWRIARGTADPSRVLAITFTREAAAEMRRRLRSLGVTRHDRAGDLDQPTIGTFHSVALALLRRRAADTSAQLPTVVGNRISLLDQALGENSLGRQSSVVLAEIDWAHARMVSPERYEAEVERLGRKVTLAPSRVAAAYRAYERIKTKRGVVDLDDLVSQATRVINERSDFAAATRFRFRHIFVDEAQDMNPLQYAFFEALRGDRDDVFIVGDPLQAIYGWNGADPALFTSLPDALNMPTVLTLPGNYRCTPQVLDVATHVATNSGVTPNVRSRRSPGFPVEYLEVEDEFDEEHLLRQIVAPHVRPGLDPSMAVLARTHAVLEPLARSLSKAGIPVASRRASAVRTNAIDEVAECRTRHDLTVWAADIIVESTDDDERIVAEQVQAYLRSSTKGEVDGRSAAAYLRASHAAPENYGVELLTFHAAKGREFSRVIIVGAERGLMPHASASTDEQLREEARLAYVACTRAADHLTVIRAKRRKGRVTATSPYFATLPDGVEHRGRHTAPAERPRLSPPTDPRVLADRDLKRRLCDVRDAIARTNFTLPEAVLSDVEISRIVTERPHDVEQLSRILGPLTANRLGTAILREVGLPINP